MERQDVVRSKKIMGGASVESLEPFHPGEVVQGPEHFGPTGKVHNGRMRITSVGKSPMGFVALGICIQKGCGKQLELEGIPK